MTRRTVRESILMQTEPIITVIGKKTSSMALALRSGPMEQFMKVITLRERKMAWEN